MLPFQSAFLNFLCWESEMNASSGIWETECTDKALRRKRITWHHITELSVASWFHRLWIFYPQHMAAPYSRLLNGNLVTAYTAIFHPLKCAQYSRKTSFDSIMTNWGEKCSWYLEKSGTEEVFILKLHYKPTSVTVMWLSSLSYGL